MMKLRTSTPPRRIINKSLTFPSVSPSLILFSPLKFNVYGAVENRPTHTFARSLLYVARYHVDRGGGDIKRALTYTEKVAQSNAEEVSAAAELLKRMLSLPGVKIEDGDKFLVSLDEEVAEAHFRALKAGAAVVDTSVDGVKEESQEEAPPGTAI